MTSFQKLNKLLEAMPENEREKTAAILLEVMNSHEWDAQIEKDSLNGKLDHLIQKAKMDHKNGRTSSFS